MNCRALVIENDPSVIDAITEVLAFLDHEYDIACSQQEAKRLAMTRNYSYMLSSVQIPARSRTGLPRIQNTENLLESMTAAKNGSMPPVIVMTDQAATNLDGTVKIMRLAVGLYDKGAVDFIGKPFPTAGRTLDRVIKKILGVATTPRRAKTPKVKTAASAGKKPARRRKRARKKPIVIAEASSDAATSSDNAAPASTSDQATGWSGVANEPVTLDEFMVRHCEKRSKESRRYRRKALLAAARHGTVKLPPLATKRKPGRANRYFTHDLLTAWQGYVGEGVELPGLNPSAGSVPAAN